MKPSIVKPIPDPDGSGVLLTVTPASAGWSYVGFRVVRLSAGQTYRAETGDNEACLVLVSGKADATTRTNAWSGIGQRMNVFERTPPYSVYVPQGDRYEVTALTDLELAVCEAPGNGVYPARLIGPGEVGAETRGSGATERYIHNILPEQEPAGSLLVVEVFTPGGHWSSYPPHKHDRDALPEESLLEETYYFHIDPRQGFAVQKVYTDDRSIDETFTVRDGEAVIVPKGYHPVGAAAGYDCYYLNVMAGPRRAWKFHNDPDHEWIVRRPAADSL